MLMDAREREWVEAIAAAVVERLALGLYYS
jgi:hypothetical protein